MCKTVTKESGRYYENKICKQLKWTLANQEINGGFQIILLKINRSRQISTYYWILPHSQDPVFENTVLLTISFW
jgi:hypothetical protein